jgi:hypothetical protein
MPEYAIQNFDENFFIGKKIAVIGKDFFNELDLQVLPKNIFYDEIGIFTGENYSIDKTYLFGNTKTLIDNIVRLITKENMNDAAIVLEPNSDYNILLQTRLTEEGIDVLIKNTYSENSVVRFMMNLIESSFEYELLQMKDIKEAGKLLGFEIDSKKEDYNIEVVINSSGSTEKDKKLKAFYKILKDSESFTFGKFTGELINKFSCFELNEFNILLDKLNFSNENISEENLIELKYILENFDLQLADKRTGVLFADAKNSAFVNREIIFYLGLDESWCISTNEKKYIDKAREDRINLEKFEILLQQGSERLYFAQDVKDNKEVLPAPYFSIIENRTISDFKDKIFNYIFINGENAAPETAENYAAIQQSSEEVTGIAPTPLKKFVLCPAKYYYESLTPQKDAPHFLKGHLVHDFAEMYFHHPEFCKENSAKIMDYILKKYSVMISKSEADIERTNFKIALDNIVSFLDGNPVEKSKLAEPIPAAKNDMMLFFKKEKVYDNTEKDLPKDFILKGRADLRDNKTLVDYKSGSSRYKLKDLPKLTNIDYIFENEENDFDFQAISYLAALKNENQSSKKLNFIYNYVLANRKNLLDERLKSEENTTELIYIDVKFLDYLKSEECYLYVQQNIKAELRRYIDFLNYEGYKDIFADEDLSEVKFYDKESMTNTISSKIIKAHQRAGLTFKNFSKKIVKTYLEDLYKLCGTFYDIKNNKGYIFKDDVEKFIGFVETKLIELNSYRKNNFPALPIFESNQICKECDYLNMCKGNLLWN